MPEAEDTRFVYGAGLGASSDEFFRLARFEVLEVLQLERSQQ